MGLKIGSSMPDLTANVKWLNQLPPRATHDQPYLVHFWTLSCDSCLTTLPDVSALMKKYESHIHAVSVNLEPEDDAEVTKQAKRAGLDAPLAIDEEALLSDAFGYNFIPAFYLFDASGQMRYFQQGQDHLGTLEQRIKRLLR
ncbi:TlpA disulfide reductase family protein [Geomicrobium sp. JCM 19039]|uniref:TlpA family protein disulfide reductase n=1 Tax=Geomicrobium sp. JCM 19039 TaxID=1460636 RepID=UPI00045F2B20|nr:TlpA disulfide reductase family protein [Geomicrobium sp. JCM 19039]GAK14452.1 DipZ protein [Geomicrobium sp. JCM 19039]